jgi:hypothetical protein
VHRRHWPCRTGERPAAAATVLTWLSCYMLLARCACWP